MGMGSSCPLGRPDLEEELHRGGDDGVQGIGRFGHPQQPELQVWIGLGPRSPSLALGLGHRAWIWVPQAAGRAAVEPQKARHHPDKGPPLRLNPSRPRATRYAADTPGRQVEEGIPGPDRACKCHRRKQRPGPEPPPADRNHPAGLASVLALPPITQSEAGDQSQRSPRASLIGEEPARPPGQEGRRGPMTENQTSRMGKPRVHHGSAQAGPRPGSLSQREEPAKETQSHQESQDLPRFPEGPGRRNWAGEVRADPGQRPVGWKEEGHQEEGTQARNRCPGNPCPPDARRAPGQENVKVTTPRTQNRTLGAQSSSGPSSSSATLRRGSSAPPKVPIDGRTSPGPGPGTGSGWEIPFLAGTGRRSRTPSNPPGRLA